MQNLRHRLYVRLIEPRSETQDSQRREFILNVLICGLTTIAGLALLSSLIHQHSGEALDHSKSLMGTLFFFLVTAGLWTISRRGGYRLVSWVLIGFMALAAFSLMLQWSFELPSAELLYVLTIVIAGVLLSTRAALLFTSFGSVAILVLAYLQANGYQQPRTDWLYNSHIEIGDAIGYVALLSLTGVVSWLSNREIERSLTRAWTSEAALEKERDSLEIKVVERTKELEQEQLRRLLTVQRFAEFGRMSSGLLHEIVNPLTAASLNLEAMPDQQSEQIVQVRKNLSHLERYIQAARRQLLGESKVTTFSLRGEINQVTRLLKPRARALSVELVVQLSGNPKLRGDAVKFSQLVSNLVANAIEAYDNSSSDGRQVVIVAGLKSGKVELQVSDHGKGISPANLAQVFEPFFSTKSASNRGMGIGLAMVKQIAEEDFGGSIVVTSSASSGTKFVVRLRNQGKS